MLKTLFSPLLVSPTTLSKDSGPGNQVCVFIISLSFTLINLRQDKTVHWFRLVNKSDLNNKT